MKIAIVSGTSINRSRIFDDWELDSVDTPFGAVELKRASGLVAVNRHGFSNPLPPHRTNYRGYVHALKSLGVESVLSLTSVGSLREDLGPGTLVSCDDYVSFAPTTFVDDAPSGFAPVIGNPLLDSILKDSPIAIATGKVYAQTRGPRFETRAEVRILKNWGCDVVGMTLANEADLLLESGIAITALSMVDNFAHGLVDQELSMEQFHASVLENQAKIDGLLRGFIERCGD